MSLSHGQRNPAAVGVFHFMCHKHSFFGFPSRLLIRGFRARRGLVFVLFLPKSPGLSVNTVAVVLIKGIFFGECLDQHDEIIGSYGN